MYWLMLIVVAVACLAVGFLAGCGWMKAAADKAARDLQKSAEYYNRAAEVMERKAREYQHQGDSRYVS